MADRKTNYLNLSLAWRRILQEQPSQSFVRHPFERRLAELNSQEFLRNLERDLQLGRYAPSSAVIANVPKGKGFVRPGACLALKDRIVYAAAVGEVLPELARSLAWTERQVDFSHRLTNKFTDNRWIVDPFKGWDTFRESSLELLQGNSYAVLADITGYYENIDIATLGSDLREAGCRDEAVQLILDCLNKWAQIPGRGIPQGHQASDILGKLYLNRVDRALADAQYVHCRYVDDMRIFCPDYATAKHVLVELSELLRARGLNLQTAKSAIQRADVAVREIEGIAPVIKSIRSKHLRDITVTSGVEDYVSDDDIDTIVSNDPDEVPIDVLHQAYQAYFIEANQLKFDKTLFHYLIKRLGKAKDRFAFQHCMTLLDLQPQETSNVLRYVTAVGAAEDALPTLELFLNSKNAIYPYQNYQVFEWLTENLTRPRPSLLMTARRFAHSGAGPVFLRTSCRCFLARFGTPSDLDKLAAAYSTAGSSLEQAEIMCCIERMEKVRRNGFLARMSNDGEWNRLAEQYLKTVPNP